MGTVSLHLIVAANSVSEHAESLFDPNEFAEGGFSTDEIFPHWLGEGLNPTTAGLHAHLGVAIVIVQFTAQCTAPFSHAVTRLNQSQTSTWLQLFQGQHERYAFVVVVILTLACGIITQGHNVSWSFIGTIQDWSPIMPRVRQLLTTHQHTPSNHSLTFLGIQFPQLAGMGVLLVAIVVVVVYPRAKATKRKQPDALPTGTEESATPYLHSATSEPPTQSAKSATPTRNVASKVRIYIRAITRELMKYNLIRGMPGCHYAPAEYWKSFDAHRSPEFLADTKMALQFARTYFCREYIATERLRADVDVEVLCSHLRGPVLYAL